jgi:hypothetical protein
MQVKTTLYPTRPIGLSMQSGERRDTYHLTRIAGRLPALVP